MEKKKFDYDEISDSLFISRKQEGERVNGSAEIGNLTLDFTQNGKIVGLEFKGISKFLEMIKIDSKILGQLKEATLVIQQQKNAVMIFALLKTNEKEQPIPLAIIPVRRTLVSSA